VLITIRRLASRTYKEILLPPRAVDVLKTNFFKCLEMFEKIEDSNMISDDEMSTRPE